MLNPKTSGWLAGIDFCACENRGYIVTIPDATQFEIKSRIVFCENLTAVMETIEVEVRRRIDERFNTTTTPSMTASEARANALGQAAYAARTTLTEGTYYQSLVDKARA